MITREHTAIGQRLKARRVLPMWNGRRFEGVFVDDELSCGGQHLLNLSRWHRYQDERGHFYAIRCPQELTFNEKANTVDDLPIGSWEAKVAVRAGERLQGDARRRLAEKEEAKRGWQKL